MPKQITSTDWHLEGVSVEVRRAVKAYAELHGMKPGQAADELLRSALQKLKLL